ncbi:Uncharacterized protein ChrSV_3883 [Chromobacterium vaccinii]|nr:Uncharacterized protein ChrSW_3883 [Chromobacterium vaccinii]QND91340.1 Uncharacterized protein ChrSV_3883 [Chromobacterium vaccinii]
MILHFVIVLALLMCGSARRAGKGGWPRSPPCPWRWNRP